jgi:hypothetical protein
MPTLLLCTVLYTPLLPRPRLYLPTKTVHAYCHHYNLRTVHEATQIPSKLSYPPKCAVQAAVT